MDALVLARAQFALNISFHILFPTITIALAWVLLFYRVQFQRTGAAIYRDIYQLWVKVFALSFGYGVVSGIVMSFQFGTNWPGFMERVGNVAGPLLAYEVLTAFFLEASFLGIMLFGAGRVSERVQTLACTLVAIGTTISAFWILALNSWMHTPAGVEWHAGVAYPVDWWAIIWNPSFPYRLVHMLLASGLTVSFLLAGISAWRWLRGDQGHDVRRTLRDSIIIASVLIPLQIFAGDLHGLNTIKHQPAKVAAMEGIWQDERGAGLRLFALPDEESRSNRFEVKIPYLASWVLTHDPNGLVRGLDSFRTTSPTGEQVNLHPPVKPLFFGFRVMVGTGIAMLLCSWSAAFFWWRRRKRSMPLAKPQLIAFTVMTLSGWLATLAGWYVTEIGRQPFLVYGFLPTEQAVAGHSAAVVGLSFGTYLLVYLLLLAVYLKVLLVLAGKNILANPKRPETLSVPVLL
jgi:cytochrome bd ubiquinol oxidase subunit I